MSRQRAAERIELLLDEAAQAARVGEHDRARRYVQLARRLAERNRLEFPRRGRRRTCDACDQYLLPGENAQVRLQTGHVVITCSCGAIKRYPYAGGDYSSGSE